MYHVSAQGVDKHMINIHYYNYYNNQGKEDPKPAHPPEAPPAAAPACWSRPGETPQWCPWSCHTSTGSAPPSPQPVRPGCALWYYAAPLPASHSEKQTCRSEGKLLSRLTGGQSNPHKQKWLASRRSEVLRSLRHYLRAQSQGHQLLTTWRQEERGSVRQSSLKGHGRAIISQTNTGTVSKMTLRKLLRDGVECIWAFPSTQIPS